MRIPKNAIVYGVTEYKYYEKYIKQGVGSRFSLKGFVSISTSRNTAQEFFDDYSEEGEKPLLLEIKVSKGTNVFFIGEKSMHDKYYTEQELILGRDTKFELESIKGDKIVLRIIE